MSTSVQLNLTHLAEGQASAEVTFNDALNKLDATIQLSVLDRDLTVPPGSPTEGDRYLPKATATGDWASNENKIAIYLSGWVFLDPKEGMQCWVADEDQMIVYTGSAWILWQGTSTQTGITAGTTQTQAGGYSITKDISIVDTCATNNDSVTLPVAELGRHILIYNSGAAKCKIWPAVGGTLDGLAINTGTVINVSRWAEMWAISATTWVMTT